MFEYIETSIYLLSISFLGYEVVSICLIKYFDQLTRLGIGISMGIISAAWVYYIINYFTHFSRSLCYNQILVYLISGFIVYYIRPKKEKVKPIPLFYQIFSIGIPFIFLSYLLWTGLLYKERFTRAAAYGDLPFHLNIISSFVYGCNYKRPSFFSVVSPFYAKEILAYPIMTDFFSACILGSFHTSYHCSLALPSVFMCFSIIVILSRFVYDFTGDFKCTIVAPYIFLCTGGMGFVSYFDPRIKRFGDYVFHIGDNKYAGWFQTVCHILLPQRASLFSIPLAWSIILLLYKFGCSISVNVPEYALTGFLIGLLPQVQPHSVVAVAQWGAFFFFISLIILKKYKYILNMFANYSVLALIAVLMGIPGIIPFLNRLDGSKEFLKIYPIWAKNSPVEPSFFKYWWKALGILFFVSTFAPLFLIDKETSSETHNQNDNGTTDRNGPKTPESFAAFASIEEKNFERKDKTKKLRGWAAGEFMFLTSCFIIYQPWKLDNTKMFNAGWLPIALACYSLFIIKLYNHKPKFRFFNFAYVLIPIFIFFTCLSGGIAVKQALKYHGSLWERNLNHIKLADFVRKVTPPDAIFLSDHCHYNPISNLAGRQIYINYLGWISSHGINGKERLNVINEVVKNPENTQKLDAFGIKYVMVDTGCPYKIDFKPPQNSTKWKKIFNEGKYTIWIRT